MDLIEDSPCVKELPVGISSRAYVFDRGDRRVVAMWKFLGDPKTLNLPKKATVYDFMGTRAEKDEITLDGFPQYLVTKGSVDQIEKLFATLDFGLKRRLRRRSAISSGYRTSRRKLIGRRRRSPSARRPILARSPAAGQASTAHRSPATRLRCVWRGTGPGS